jgi:DNA-binding GntR family transcriptional regulator
VPEQQLCARFGVSRTPLREALKVLASEGLLTLLPHRGARVAAISAEEIEELFPIMGAIEALAGELAAERISDAEIERIRDLHARMAEHFARGERAAYARLNEEIHDAIFAAAGNASLAQIYRQLMMRIRRVRFVARMSPARWREAIEDHEAIVTALEARDGPRLAAVLRAHVALKAATVLEALAEAG